MLTEFITFGVLKDSFSDDNIRIGDSAQNHKLEFTFKIDDMINGIDNHLSLSLRNSNELYSRDCKEWTTIAEFLTRNFGKIVPVEWLHNSYVLLNDELGIEENVLFKEIDQNYGEISSLGIKNKLYVRKIFDEDDDIIEERVCISIPSLKT
jgi:hypothetical protein